jgi:hypothetical protein
MNDAGARGMAERLREAFTSGDSARLEPLLDPRVRWGGEEDSDHTCRTRHQVLDWYRSLQAAGVRARVTEALALDGAVVLGLDLTAVGPGPRGGQVPGTVWQVFRLEAGLVADIRGFPRREQALALAAAPARSGVVSSPRAAGRGACAGRG